MSLSKLLLAIFLILLGATWLTWISVSNNVLGLLAFITGVVFLIEAFRPITLPRP